MLQSDQLRVLCILSSQRSRVSIITALQLRLQGLCRICRPPVQRRSKLRGDS